MTTHTFWIFALRITGIIIIVFGLDDILRLFNDLIQFRNSMDFPLIVLFSVSLFFYAFILIGFVFNPEMVIRSLKLMKGIEHMEIKLDYKSEYYLKMIVMVIGGVFFLNSIADLSVQLINYIQYQSDWSNNPLLGAVVFSLIKLAIGYYLFFHSGVIVKIFKDKLDEDDQVLDNSDKAEI
jgi:hypothetical protein